MKIALVLDDTLDTPDGVQQYVLQVGRWLDSQGHDVHYLVGNTLRKDIANVHSLSRNLQVRFNGNRMSMPLPVNRRKLKRFLAEQQFDVLHVQVPYSPFLAGRILKTVPLATAVVGTFHILPYSHLVAAANRVLALLNHTSAKRFDQMVAVSAPARKFARQVYGYDTEVVPNPVNLSQFESATSIDPSLNIVFLGRLVARKGALQLLRAVAYVREHNMFEESFQVSIGGKGDLLPELERFTRAHHLEEVVTFHGFINEAEKAMFLAQADIAVYPSTGGESFGIVLLEAFAAARGVVLAGDNSGYASVMQPYPDQLFEPDDTVAFAEKLAWYLAHPMGRARASEAQHEYVRHFDIGVVGGELLEVYRKALQSRPNS